MTNPRINRIEIQGFRAFGRNKQELVFHSPIAAVWAPNSQGKTSLAEAFEFLLTGQIVRRQLMASTQDEFADALRNAHIPAAMPVYVEAEIVGTDGTPHRVKRTLLADYAKRQDCSSALEIDGTPANQEGLAALGIVLSQPPLAAPVLAQHTLGYLFSARPQDRASYFKAVLEVTDLEELRRAVASLDAEIEPRDDPNWAKLLRAAENKEVTPSLLPPLALVPSADDLAEALDGAVSAVLHAAGADAPQTEAERLAALEALLSQRRAKTFPIDGFKRNPLPQWSDPPKADWDALDAYLSEREKVDEETRRLSSLFAEALAIPAVATAADAINCPLCATDQSLTPERIAYIRAQVQETETFQIAERAALEALRRLSAKAQTLDAAVTAACPRFLKTASKDRRKSGFRMGRIPPSLATRRLPRSTCGSGD
jgi:AAA domain